MVIPELQLLKSRSFSKTFIFCGQKDCFWVSGRKQDWLKYLFKENCIIIFNVVFTIIFGLCGLLYNPGCFSGVKNYLKQGRRENSEAPGPNRKTKPPANEASENFQGLEINFRKLMLVYLMRSPDLEALGVMRSLGACGLGAICPPDPSRRPWLKRSHLPCKIFPLTKSRSLNTKFCSCRIKMCHYCHLLLFGFSYPGWKTCSHSQLRYAAMWALRLASNMNLARNSENFSCVSGHFSAVAF